MATDSTVAEHYGRDQPIDRIRDQLVSAGLDLEHLRPEDISGVDEFHLGGKLATVALLKSATLTGASRVLDVGCGIGGAARTVASLKGCHVTGVDLTPTFVETAEQLSEMVGLAGETNFETANATALRFADDEFDAVTLLHVGMNIADKGSLFAELKRVLRPGGTLHVYDIMRTGNGDLAYPMPWATDPSTSFLAEPEEYVEAMLRVGLAPGEPVDRTDLVEAALRKARESPPVVNLSLLMGAEWPLMFSNLLTSLASDVLAPIEIVATAPAGD